MREPVIDLNEPANGSVHPRPGSGARATRRRRVQPDVMPLLGSLPPVFRRFRELVDLGGLEFIRKEGPEVRPMANALSRFENSDDFSSTIPKVAGVLCVAVIPAAKMKPFLLARKRSLPVEISARDVQTLCFGPIEERRFLYHRSWNAVQREAEGTDAVDRPENRPIVRRQFHAVNFRYLLNQFLLAAGKILKA